MIRFRLLRLLVLPALALATPFPAAAQSTGAGKAYCYRTDASTFRLDVGGDGRATFVLDSWQDGGHSCSGSGTAKPTATGWLYEKRLDGGPCKMEIRPGKDGGLVLSDANWGCKATLCGARAVIDGLAFPRSSQVSCASLPAQ